MLTGARPEPQKTRAGEPEDHALGRSRGGFGTKLHLVCDRLGNPLGVQLSPGQAHECRYFETSMYATCGLAEDGTLVHRPGAVAGDKGYSSGEIRTWLADHGIQDVIPTKSNETRRENFDKEMYRQRNVVERCIGWLKENRRIATRYEKLAVHYLAMVKLGVILRMI